jgi:hypothetical protein
LLLALLSLWLPAAPALAAVLDPKAVVLPAADLGPNWTVAESSAESTPEGNAFSTFYVNETDYPRPRAASFVVVVTGNATAAERIVSETHADLTSRGTSVGSADGLGDNGGFKTLLPLEQAAALAYFYRVSNVFVLVAVLGEPGRETELDAQARDFASRQQDRVRALLASPPPPPAFCKIDETPTFQFGFAQLKALLGSRMGQPTECEHQDPASGDTLQATTTGLAQYLKGANLPTFTNGFDHWAITPQGLVHWIGPSTSPPPDATLVVTSPGIPTELQPAWDALRTVPAPRGSGKDNLAELAEEWLAATGVKIEVDVIEGGWGVYSGATNTITIAPAAANDIPAAAAAVLIHELRHAVQQVEGERNCVAREVDSLSWEITVWDELTGGGVPNPTTDLQLQENALLDVVRTQGEPGLYKLVVDHPGYQAECQLFVP